MKRINGLITVLILISLMTACSHSDLDKNGVPRELRIGISTSTEEPTETFRRLEPLRLYLERKLHMPVKLLKVNGYAPIIEAMKAKKIHMGSISPFSYLIARKKSGAQAIFVLGTTDGLQRTSSSCIFTNRSSGLKTIDDIKANMSHLTLAFSDPASTSGHIIPRKFLMKNGIDPEKDFKKVVFTNDHAACVLSLLSGKVDLACSQMTTLYRIKKLKKDFDPEKSLNMVWVSAPIPAQPWCIRKDINPQFRQKILDAYLSIKEDSAAWNAVVKGVQMYRDISGDTLKYIPTKESWYDDLEKTVGSIEGIKLPE